VNLSLLAIFPTELELGQRTGRTVVHASPLSSVGTRGGWRCIPLPRAQPAHGEAESGPGMGGSDDGGTW
jgi:hypothetical protein